MSDIEPNLVISGKSQRVVIDGYPFSIEIHRLEADDKWTLEVVDQDGTSHVWDELFQSDGDACDVAIQTIQSEGPITFMRGNNIIPFPSAD